MSCAMAVFSHLFTSRPVPLAQRRWYGIEHPVRVPANSLGSCSHAFRTISWASSCQLRRNELFCIPSDASQRGIDNVAEVGDMVTVHFRLRTSEGELLESSEFREPLTFELGAGQVMGNPLFQSFDLAAMGMTAGETRTFEAASSERDPGMVFQVPPDHPEVQRLQQESDTPLEVGAMVKLANGEPAVITGMDDKFVVIDANHLLAGVVLTFEVELMSIDKSSNTKAHSNN